jgi:hypothetical protein
MKVMKKEQQNWQETLMEMNRALDEMRINYQRTVKLKNIENARNPLLDRRMNKANNHAAQNQNNTIDVPDEAMRKIPPMETSTNDDGATDGLKANILQESDGLLIANRRASNSSPSRFKRMRSMPTEHHASPLTVFYYSSALNEPSETNKAHLFK